MKRNESGSNIVNNIDDSTPRSRLKDGSGDKRRFMVLMDISLYIPLAGSERGTSDHWIRGRLGNIILR